MKRRVSFVALLMVASWFHADARAAKPTSRPGHAKPAADEPLRIATAYLNALEGSGDEYARSYLLGKVTVDAALVQIANWKIVERQPEQIEKGALLAAIKSMAEVDRVGNAYLKKKYKLKSAEQVQREQARDVLRPTQAAAERFIKAHPLFARVARAGKWVYWNPHNPLRRLIPQLGKRGDYELRYHHFVIEETRAKGQTRRWPLRVLRIKTDIYDSGWKILPASNWDPTM